MKNIIEEDMDFLNHAEFLNSQIKETLRILEKIKERLNSSKKVDLNLALYFRTGKNKEESFVNFPPGYYMNEEDSEKVLEIIGRSFEKRISSLEEEYKTIKKTLLERVNWRG